MTIAYSIWATLEPSQSLFIDIRHLSKSLDLLAGSPKLTIDGKLSEGYIIGCDCEAYFIVPRLGVSVECPHCGKTELPDTMLMNWTLTATGGILFHAAD